MVLKNMKTLLRSLFFILLTLCFSCEKTGLVIVNCNDCVQQEPKMTELNIKLDISEMDLVKVNVYAGNVEDNILYGSFRAGRGTSASYEVYLNKKYTLTAEYSINGKTYIAVDSAFPRVKYDKESCDQPCYYIYDTILDLRLKYTK